MYGDRPAGPMNNCLELFNSFMEEMRHHHKFVEKHEVVVDKRLRELERTNPKTKGLFYNLCRDDPNVFGKSFKLVMPKDGMKSYVLLRFITSNGPLDSYIIIISPEGFHMYSHNHPYGTKTYSSLDCLLKHFEKEVLERLEKKELAEEELKKNKAKKMEYGTFYGRSERQVARRLRHILSNSLKWAQADRNKRREFTHDLSQQTSPGPSLLLLPATAPVSYRLVQPLNGPYYSRVEAATLVFAQTVNNTSERSLIMNDIVNKKLVPVKIRVLQDLISKIDYPKLHTITGKNWGHNPGREKFRLYFEGPRKKVEVDHGEKDYGDWVGSIRLRVAKVNHLSLFRAVKKNSEQLLRQEIVSSVHKIDVCPYLGKACQQSYDREALCDITCRLYFNPDKFPLPPAGVRVASSPQFKAVKEYIRFMAMKSGNPVVCNGSGGNKDSKVFLCAECYRKKGGEDSPVSKHKSSCDFSLILKWDSIAFYIHLNEFGRYFVSKNVGNNIHTCGMLKDHLFRDSYGVSYLTRK